MPFYGENFRLGCPPRDRQGRGTKMSRESCGMSLVLGHCGVCQLPDDLYAREGGWGGGCLVWEPLELRLSEQELCSITQHVLRYAARDRVRNTCFCGGHLLTNATRIHTEYELPCSARACLRNTCQPSEHGCTVRTVLICSTCLLTQKVPSYCSAEYST